MPSHVERKKAMQAILDGISSDYEAIDRVKHLTRNRPINPETQTFRPKDLVWVSRTIGGNHAIKERYEGVVVRPLEQLVKVSWVDKHGKTRIESLPLNRLEHRND